MEAKRHTCIVCKSKRAAYKMIRFRSHWACTGCFNDPVDPGKVSAGLCVSSGFKILNLYAGIGGNRRDWNGSYDITAIEYNPKVAAEYKRLYPEDNVIVGDAHQYLLKNYWKFDFIWSSPPCPTHSRMNYGLTNEKRRYIDLSLYQEIILLKTFFKGLFVIENVIPYYDALVPFDYVIGRHVFWSNFPITETVSIPYFKDFITTSDKQALMDYLGIYMQRNIYLTGKDKNQILRNCCHPLIGASVLNDVMSYRKKTK